MTSSENRVSSAETFETTDHHFEAGVGGRYRQGLSESAVRMNIKKSGYRVRERLDGRSTTSRSAATTS